MCKPRTRAMVSALKLETENQYGVTDDQYEVLKSSACLQEETMLLLLSLASLFTANSHTLKPFFLYCAFHSFFVEKAVTLNFGLLAVQSQEERIKKRGKSLALQPKAIQNIDLNPNPLHFRCCMLLSPENSK